VALVVVLIPMSRFEPPLKPAALSELARLGVTRVAVAGDDDTVALVVEGWAFDPGRCADAVIAAVGAQTSGPRTLQPLADMALSGASVKTED
jgi:hypothetical protein